MKLLLLQVAALAAATTQYVAQANTASTFYPHVPLILWSKRPIFQGSNSYVSESLDESGIISVLKNTLTRDLINDAENILNHQEIAFPTAEVLCVFVRESLPLEQVSSLGDDKQPSFVENAVVNALSSVVVPHTTRTQSLISTLKEENAHVVPIQELDDFVASDKGKKMLTNYQTDLLVVKISNDYSLPKTDALIQKASEKLVDASKGLVDFALTGDDAPATEIVTPTRRLSVMASKKKTIECESGYIVGYNGDKPYCFSHYVLITPQILVGLIIGIFFIFLTYVGLSVMHAIQTPAYFPTHGPPRGKEY